MIKSGQMDGILPVYKPTGITSYDVIRKFKQSQNPPSHKASAGKVGHAGTLDPFANGVLILMLGKATKRFDEIGKWRKTYRAHAVLGAKTNTLDKEGEIIIQKQVPELRKEDLERMIDKYTGEIEQDIPSFSAVKYKGKPLYKYAREGKITPLKSKKVTIHSIEVEELHDTNVVLEIVCSSGTYIRQLSFDILKELGIDSYLNELTRLKIGEIAIDDCIKIEDFGSGQWKRYLREN